MKRVHIHNGTDEQKTLAALQKAASNARGKARGVIQGLATALSHNPASRGRNEKESSMAKKKTRRATARRRTAPNPTPRTRKRAFRRSTRSNPSGLASRVKSLDLTGILMEGAGVAAGGLATSFVARQAARILPDMSPTLRAGLSTVLTAAGLAYFSRGKGFLRSMAVGSLAGGLTQMAATLAPGLFAGLDGADEMQGWTPSGDYIEGMGAAEDEMGGTLFDQSGPAPYVRNF